MIKKLLFIFLFTYPQFSHSSVEVDFNIWLKKFKITAQKEGISKETIINRNLIRKWDPTPNIHEIYC